MSHAEVMISYVSTTTLPHMQARFKAANYTLVSKTHSSRIGPGTILVIVNTDSQDIIMTVKASGTTVYDPMRSCNQSRPYIIPINPTSIREVSISLKDLVSRLQITDTTARTNITKLTAIEYSRPFIKTDNEAGIVAAYVSLIKDLYKFKLRLCHITPATEQTIETIPSSIKIRLIRRSVSPPHAAPEIPQPVEATAPVPVAPPTTLIVKSPCNSLEHNGCITALTWMCVIATLLVAYVRLTEPVAGEVSRLLDFPESPLYRLENGPIPNQYLRHTGIWG
jgi:hypothetical protein